jgi:carbamate kinase
MEYIFKYRFVAEVVTIKMKVEIERFNNERKYKNPKKQIGVFFVAELIEGLDFILKKINT